MTTIPTVYVIDDDEAIRRSTGFVLQAAGLPHETFESPTAFLEDFERGSPGCLLLDLEMPGLNGIDLLQMMAKEQITLPVVIVSGTGTISIAVQGMKLGVADFLEKPVHPDLLLEKVRNALALDATRRTEKAAITPLRDRLATLTAREREVLDCIVEGLPNKLIASKMNISIKTVTNHRASLMAKTEAANTADVVRMYMNIKAAEHPPHSIAA